MYKYLSVIIVFAFAPFFGLAQNLIHNASFEHYKHCPSDMGDFPCMKWHVPFEEFTPDYFSKCAPKGSPMYIGSSWLKVEPFAGKSYIGLVALDTENSFREYVSTKLIERLVKDTTYVFRVAISQPNYARWKVGELGLMITEKRIEDSDENLFLQTPSVTLQLNGKDLREGWQVLEYEYKASGNEKHLTIGNYRKDKHSEVELIKENKDLDERSLRSLFSQAYYLLDAVSFQQKYKHKAHITFERKTNAGSKIHDLLITKFVFNNLNFDTDSSAIASHELSTLDTVVDLMKQHPEYRIIITGHTDDRGASSKNKELSERRAKTISHYIIGEGIKETRIQCVGKGDSTPIVSNDSDLGKRKNRRIEIEFHTYQ